jgi:hypothetical protein
MVIHIPVLSNVYKAIVGSDLTILDLVCPVAAVPATIVTRIITGHDPFPDDKRTNNVIHATTWADFASAFFEVDASVATPPNLMLSAADSGATYGKLESFGAITQSKGSAQFCRVFSGVCRILRAIMLGIQSADIVEDKHLVGFQGITFATFFLSTIFISIPSFVFNDRWTAKLGFTVWVVTLGTRLLLLFDLSGDPKLKKVLPIVDSVIGVVAMISPIGSMIIKSDTPSALLGPFGGISWNLNRILNPASTDPDVREGRIVVMLISAILQFINACFVQGGDDGD